MLSMFDEVDIINKLKTIVKSLEENQENKMMLYAFIMATNKEPIKCECEGIDRINCPKCKGMGYIIVDKEKK